MNDQLRLLLPGRGIDELVGPVTLREQHPHQCKNNRCLDASHQRHKDAFINDKRPGSSTQNYHKANVWYSHWALAPHPDLVDAVRKAHGTEDINQLTIIRRPDGTTLLTVDVGSQWLGHYHVTLESCTPTSACQNCDWVGDDTLLKPIQQLLERVAPGEPMPSGECPACGCLCHTVKTI